MTKTRLAFLTWLIVLALALCLGLAYLGPQLIAYVQVRERFSANDPTSKGVNAEVISLRDTSFPPAPGTVISHFGYAFEVPFVGISQTHDAAIYFETLFQDGVFVTMMNPDYINFDYDTLRGILVITPAGFSPFCSRSAFANNVHLLSMKANLFEHNSASTNIFSFENDSQRGFEVSGIANGWQWAELSVFSTDGERLQLIVSEVPGSSIRLNQQDMNRIIRTLKPSLD